MNKDIHNYERVFRNYEKKLREKILFQIAQNNDYLLEFSKWYLATRGKYGRLNRYSADLFTPECQSFIGCDR